MLNDDCSGGIGCCLPVSAGTWTESLDACAIADGLRFVCVADSHLISERLALRERLRERVCGPEGMIECVWVLRWLRECICCECAPVPRLRFVGVTGWDLSSERSALRERLRDRVCGPEGIIECVWVPKSFPECVGWGCAPAGRLRFVGVAGSHLTSERSALRERLRERVSGPGGLRGRVCGPLYREAWSLTEFFWRRFGRGIAQKAY